VWSGATSPRSSADRTWPSEVDFFGVWNVPGQAVDFEGDAFIDGSQRKVDELTPTVDILNGLLRREFPLCSTPKIWANNSANRSSGVELIAALDG
jgi:hypothetical protein